MSKSNNSNVNTNNVSNNYGSTMIIGKESHGGEVIIENNSSLKKIILKDDVEVDCMRIEECENLTSFEFGENARINYLELESNDKDQVKKLLNSLVKVKKITLNKEALPSVEDFFMAGLFNESIELLHILVKEKPRSQKEKRPYDGKLKEADIHEHYFLALEEKQYIDAVKKLSEVCKKYSDNHEYIVDLLYDDERDILKKMKPVLQNYINSQSQLDKKQISASEAQNNNNEPVDKKTAPDTDSGLCKKVLEVTETLERNLKWRELQQLGNFKSLGASTAINSKWRELEQLGKTYMLTQKNRPFKLIGVFTAILCNEKITAEQIRFCNNRNNLGSLKLIAGGFVLERKRTTLTWPRHDAKKYFELRDAILKNYKKGGHVLANLSKEQRDLSLEFLPELEERIREYNDQDHDKENANAAIKSDEDYKLISSVYGAVKGLQFMLLRKEIGAPVDLDASMLWNEMSSYKCVPNRYKNESEYKSIFLIKEADPKKINLSKYTLRNLFVYGTKPFERTRDFIEEDAKWHDNPPTEDYRKQNEISPLGSLNPQEKFLLIKGGDKKTRVLKVRGKNRDLFIDLLRCDKLNEDCVEFYGISSPKFLCPTMQGTKKYFELRDKILENYRKNESIETSLTEDQKQLLVAQLPTLEKYVKTHAPGWACEDRSKLPELPEDYALIEGVYEAAKRVACDKAIKNENDTTPSDEIKASKAEKLNNSNSIKK